MTYGPAVNELPMETNVSQDCNTASSIRKSLRFLFGDDK